MNLIYELRRRISNNLEFWIAGDVTDDGRYFNMAKSLPYNTRDYSLVQNRQRGPILAPQTPETLCE